MSPLAAPLRANRMNDDISNVPLASSSKQDKKDYSGSRVNAIT